MESLEVSLHPFVPAADTGRDTAQAPGRSRDHTLQGTKPLPHVINQKLLKAPMWQVGQEFCKRGDPRPGQGGDLLHLHETRTNSQALDLQLKGFESALLAPSGPAHRS